MKKNINFNELIVNPENYRFDAVDDQEQAIDLMIEEKGLEIFNLAKDILDNGLDQAKDIRVLSISQDKYLVLDGNRRITAVKCLHNPSIIKDNNVRSKFVKLGNASHRIPVTIQCFIYDTEVNASKWIKLDHTGKNSGIGQDPWGSAEVDRFGYKFEGKISPAMQAVQAVEKATGIPLNTKKLKISTINRIFSNPEARSFLGIDVKNKIMLFTADENEVIDRLSKLFSKVINDNVAVAEVYDSGLVIKFMQELFGSKPELLNEQKALFTDPTTTQSDSENENSTNGIKFQKKTGTLLKKDWITDNEYREYSGSDKVKALLKEMKSLDPQVYPTTLIPSIRVLLESALHYKLAKLGHIAIIIAQYKKKNKEENERRAKKDAKLVEIKRNWSPSFREMISYIATEENNVITDPLIRSRFESLLLGKENVNFVADLNDFIHNVHNVPGKEDPEKIWKKFGRLFLSVINEM